MKKSLIISLFLIILISCSQTKSIREPASFTARENRLLRLLEKGKIGTREFLAKLVGKLRVDHETLPTPTCHGQEMRLYEECVGENEEEMVEDFLERLMAVQRANMNRKDHRGEKGKMVRGFHAKEHACLKGEVTINSSQALELHQGVFSKPGKKYEALIRFSNAKGVSTKDFKPDLRGMAVKFLGVEGERLDPSLKETNTQDFVMFNKPTTIGSHPREAMEFAEVLAKGKMATAKYMIKNTKVAIELNKAFSVTRSLATETFYSAAPYGLGKYGDSKYRAIKFQFKPCSHKEYIERGRGFRSQDYLENNLVKNLKEQDLCFDINLQVQSDVRLTPLEDGAVEWRESDSPFQKMARLIIPKGQDIESDKSKSECKNMSFNPWNGIKEHRPLSATNRVRRLIYQHSLLNRLENTRQMQRIPESQ
jgi:hypothetical protein